MTKLNYKIPDRTKAPENGKTIDLHIQEIVELVFDNGLKVYSIDAGDEDVTRLDIIFKAGSAFQNKRLIASTTAKLLKEGTRTFSSVSIAEKLDYFGAYFDIHVTKDSATLTLYSLTKHLHELLPIVSEILSDATFPEHELETYLDLERQEFIINSEKVRYKAMLEFNKLIFGEDSAYGQSVEINDFGLLNRDDLQNFYEQNYTVDNAYVIISGKANEEVSTLIKRYLGNGFLHPKSKKPEVHYMGKNGIRNKFIEKSGALQSAIRIGRPIMNKTHPDYNKFVLLNTILGGYFGSRLMSNLREDKGYTYGVSSFNSNYINGAAFSITTEVNAKYTQSAIDEIFKEMKILRETKVSTDELDLVKNYIYGTFLRNFDGPFALADRFQSVRDFGLGFDYYLNSLEQLMRINAEEVRETANKYLDPSDMIQLVVGSFE